MFPWQQFARNPKMMNQIALQDSQGEVFTWQQLNYVIQQYTAILQEQGVALQTGVALYGKNELRLLLLYLAAIQLGARVLPINPAFPIDKVQQICSDADIAFYYSPTPLALINCQSINFDIKVICNENVLKERSVLQHFLLPATMTLTSGSTGKAKAVVHHIQAHLDNAMGVCQLMQFHTHHSWLLSLPLYHVSGQGIIWRWLLTGARLNFPQTDFYASVCRSSHVSLVPTQLQRLLAYWQAYPSCQFITQHILLGGAHIPVELTQQLMKRGVFSYSGYGMTEMASTVFAKLSDEKDGVGQPLLNREYQLVNDEIWLRGAGLAMGYWQAGSIIPLTNEQGWLQTKDKGIWLDNELVILGRVDNMFISGGENIQPEEIERVIQNWQYVKQVFVLPKEDLEFGQRPVAFVEFSQPFSVALVTELQNWLVNKLEKFKQPVQYFALDTHKLQQGAIKISRARLKLELQHLLGK
ncbi:o-succinylbenzoate--CoA ligase [Pasteurella canis]|uniref:o-succinylbenzoate--CoA ligase n=1 Tax=Pasteurella canis TaxID=753 RepID=UPI00132550C2|nr:o-succinylbenzoate--CoA ligase [Pasteurella canis]MXN88744.1 o-succinylbenzoate--CoA ligase [Pasteurella canis]